MGKCKTILFSDFSVKQQSVEVWDNNFTAHIAKEDINLWLSYYLDNEVQLCWVGKELTRRVKRYPNNPLSFADGYPFLLINHASFDLLADRCPSALRLGQFRPNLVVSGSNAFEEDQWHFIRIGDITFELVKPCQRCSLTTINIHSGRQHSFGEPLNTLKQFRTAENGHIYFGHYLIAQNTGVIRVTDPVEILSTRPAIHYGAEKASGLSAQSNNYRRVNIHYGGIQFSGNNQQVILEQLEQQGIQVPYSCRAGFCGCCYLTLVEGEVLALTADALRNQSQGTTRILSCSCIPNSDIILA